MNRGTAAVIASIVAGLFYAGAAFAVEMNLMTGSEKGTYYQFGLNLQALTKTNGINMSVYPSKGSVENIYAVYQRPGVQVGIVQSDVLAFVARVQTDQTLQRIAKKIKMVFPLYNEEVHLLARKGIGSFDDLAGKRVAIGREGSGTYLTTRLLFKVSGSRAPGDGHHRHRRGPGRAQGRANRRDVLRRRVSRAAPLGGRHRDRRPRARPDHQQGHRRVLPARRDPREHLYLAAPARGDRRGQGGPRLVRLPANRLRNRGALRASRVDESRLADKNGHPKWRSVNLEFPLKGWDQYDCVRRFIVSAPVVAPTVPPRPPAGGDQPGHGCRQAKMLNR